MAQELKARISLRKDNSTNWSRNGSQKLLDGEVIFIDGAPGNNVTRLIVGEGGENVFNAISGDNTSSLTTTGKNFLRDASKVHDPTQRSTNCNIFYSGVGAGYMLPTASETLLGGIKIDNSLFQVVESRLYLKHAYLRPEAGKGVVIHIGNDASLEVDNNLYVNTLRATDHYTQLGHFLDLNKDVTRKVDTLNNELWEFVGELDPLEIYDTTVLEDIPFIVYVPSDDPEEGEGDEPVEPIEPTEPEEEEEIIVYDKIYIQNGVVVFTDKEEKVKTTVYSSQKWLNERFRTIQFLEDNSNTNYMRTTYINKLLRLGNPIPTKRTEMKVTPLSASEKPYAGMIIHNWKYEKDNAKHAFFGMNCNGQVLFSNNFNLLTKEPSFSTERYILMSDEIYDKGDHKNFIYHVGEAENGQTVVKASDIANFVTPEYVFNRLTTDESGPLSIENKDKVSITHNEANTTIISINKKEEERYNDLTKEKYFVTNIDFDKYGHLKEVKKTNYNYLIEDVYETKTTLESLMKNEIGSQEGTDNYTLWWFASKHDDEIKGINEIIGKYNVKEFDPIAVRLTDLEIDANAFNNGKLGKPSNQNETRTVWKIIEALETKIDALENELNMLKQ